MPIISLLSWHAWFAQETHNVWHEDGSREAVENWSKGPIDPPTMLSVIIVNGFHPLKDDSMYNMELNHILFLII